MCRLICILQEALRLIRPLSGGSAPYFTLSGEAGLLSRAHASGAERGEVAAACPLRTFALRYSDGSSEEPEPVGSSGGTVTFSGVTSPGMKVISASSVGSPSSFTLRLTRIVEPGSIARPRT